MLQIKNLLSYTFFQCSSFIQQVDTKVVVLDENDNEPEFDDYAISEELAEVSIPYFFLFSFLESDKICLCMNQIASCGLNVTNLALGN